MRFWNRRKPAAPPQCDVRQNQPYALARTGTDEAEIALYGDIVRQRPCDEDGNPVEGQYIILQDFLDDLARAEDVAHLTVRIHSAGGNACDAMAIHNRLQAMAAKVTVIVDGVAMSGGSLIMCAGDRVLVYPGSLIMVHSSWSILHGGYNAAELRELADNNEAIDRSQAAIYQAKTGLPTEELLAMMAAETYMTGQEAVEKGFADALIEGAGVEIAASANRRTLFAGGMPVWTSARRDGIPDALHLPTVSAEAEIMAGQAAAEDSAADRNITDRKQGGHMENRDEMQPAAVAQATTPKAVAQAADAIQAERRRMQEIDALASLYDAETIQAAKYGDTACTAQEMVYRAAQNAARQGCKFLTALETDTGASGAQEVGAAVSTDRVSEGENLTPAQLMAKGRADAKALVKTEQEGK